MNGGICEKIEVIVVFTVVGVLGMIPERWATENLEKK